MPSTLTTKNNPGLFALFKGSSGSGKSTEAMSFPSPYIFDFDRKMPGIALKGYPDKEIVWDTFDDVFQVSDKLGEFWKHCPYETLIVDTFTTLANLSLTSLAIVKGEGGIMPFQKIKENQLGAKRGKSASDEFLGFDYYKAEEHFCTYFIDQLKGLWSKPGNPKNVIICAHVVTQESAPNPLKNNEVTVQTSIVSKGRKVAAWLPSSFDNVFLFEHQSPEPGAIDKSGKRLVYTQQAGENNAKCALNIPKIIDVSKEHLYNQILNYIDFA